MCSYSVIILSLCYVSTARPILFFFFFFNDTATTEIYTLSLHDALPISFCGTNVGVGNVKMAGLILFVAGSGVGDVGEPIERDRESTRLNSSHSQKSYAVFCLKKKKKIGNHVLCSHSYGTPPQRIRMHTLCVAIQSSFCRYVM